jgi:hypothetical protein
MYSPSAILRAGGLDPVRVAEACGLADVDVAPVKPAPAWMERMWRGPVAAMALPWGVYVKRDRLGDPGLAPLVMHELVHVRQWRTQGAVRFLLGYVGEYLGGRLRGLSHGQAYLAISAESEARRIAGC